MRREPSKGPVIFYAIIDICYNCEPHSPTSVAPFKLKLSKLSDFWDSSPCLPVNNLSETSKGSGGTGSMTLCPRRRWWSKMHRIDTSKTTQSNCEDNLLFLRIKWKTNRYLRHRLSTIVKGYYLAMNFMTAVFPVALVILRRHKTR